MYSHLKCMEKAIARTCSWSCTLAAMRGSTVVGHRASSRRLAQLSVKLSAVVKPCAAAARASARLAAANNARAPCRRATWH